MPAATANPRARVLDLIERWQQGDQFADALLERGRRGLPAADGALLQGLFYGWIRHQRLLDHWASHLWQKPPRPAVARLIETGLLQLLILELADHAVVHETVSLAPKSQRGFTNALLRRAIRERDELLGQRDRLPPAIASSHPDWLVSRWQEQLDDFQLGRLLTWNNEPAPLTGRLNPLSAGPEASCASPSAEAESGTDPGGEPLKGWPDYRAFDQLPQEALAAGRVYLTDPSTSLAPRLLDPQPGESVLDACAAPGGKSFQLAALAGNCLELVATDPSAKRLARLEGNLERLGVQAEVAAHDWTELCPPAWRGQFSAILLDLPCSNTGVLRRRVDARWRLQPEDFEPLLELQQRIARNALEALAPGGRLVWSTCSIDREENRRAVERFVAGHEGLEIEQEVAVTPWQHQVDGAYAALIRRGPSPEGEQDGRI